MRTNSLDTPSPNRFFPRLLHFGFDCLFAIIILLAVFLAYGTVPNRWYHVLYIYSGSMAPTIRPGDLIVITPPSQQLKPGMIVTLSLNGELGTHRLIAIGTDGSLATKGDANFTPDGWDTSDIQVRGIYRGRIPLLGYIVTLPKRLLMIGESGAWFTDSGQVAGELGTIGWPSPTPSPTPSAPGTSIEATIEALPFYVPYPDQSEMNVYGVEGEVCVTNIGDAPTQGLTMDIIVEYKPESGAFQPLDGDGVMISAPEQLMPGQTQCYPYSISFTPTVGIQYRVVARVIILNHSGWLPGGPQCIGPEPCPFGPEPKASFEFDDDIFESSSTGDVGLPEPTATPTPTPTEMSTQTGEPPNSTPSLIVTPPPEQGQTEWMTPVESPTAEATMEPSPTPLPSETPTEIPTVDPTPEPSSVPVESETPTEP